MINNASDISFDQVNQMPNMSSTLDAWCIPLTFGIVRKTQVGFLTKETVEYFNFLGVWQPLTPERIRLKPEGQRSWKWFWCHSRNDLNLKNDDVIQYRGKKYRVMANKDYSLNGFYEYELIEDYTGAGPQEDQ